MQKTNYRRVIKILKNGGIGVMPTDTIYGLLGSALFKKAVERIYKVRRREARKPFIILVSSFRDLKKFEVRLSKSHLKLLKVLWSFDAAQDKPGPVSVILPCKSKRLRYLHRGTNTLAFRVLKDKRLLKTLKKTGPLVAPSANISGRPPAKTIKEAKKYFGPSVDFYLDRGKINREPSTLIEIKR